MQEGRKRGRSFNLQGVSNEISSNGIGFWPSAHAAPDWGLRDVFREWVVTKAISTRLAQLGEHQTENLEVAGSTPVPHRVGNATGRKRVHHEAGGR